MLGLFVIGITIVMICNLVRNALVGKQLSADDIFDGSIELIIPITARSEFYLEPWMKALEAFTKLPGHLKIHILIDGHHPALTAWKELQEKLPHVELHSFINRPVISTHPATWMIEQIAPKITGSVVIIGDAELVPTEYAFISLGKHVTQKDRAYFVMPQTAKRNTVGESIALINPTLALVSVFGFRKFTKSLSHPMMSIAQGWMGMPLEAFKNLKFKEFKNTSWKHGMAQQWDSEGKFFALAFGERHLRRYYPEDLKVQLFQMKTYWDELWANGDKTGFWLYLTCLFIWSFPILCFLSHPFWSLASFVLLLLYRFFSKIVFQETWRGLALHPFGCLIWLLTFFWWAVSGMRSKYGSRARINI